MRAVRAVRTRIEGQGIGYLSIHVLTFRSWLVRHHRLGPRPCGFRLKHQQNTPRDIDRLLVARDELRVLDVRDVAEGPDVFERRLLGSIKVTSDVQELVDQYEPVWVDVLRGDVP